ncbi:antitoxin [Galbitalea sp. SE-J8]|uniref:FitA-like ribbon-helix-helix domain-containing protein n=1 Tax=Galbitalea sp. SE-J8 TaxID=3054952 RepID=UPI00259D2BDC|nr:antitoxin [Galbitalea sp. SE-J8]MDM4762098.1 antitoxin [Galbitalea sp. SE-J8]
MALIQVRNVPDDLHRRLKERAAREGVTLSDLALGELRRSVERPTRGELMARLAVVAPSDYRGETAAESVRAERDSR